MERKKIIGLAVAGLVAILLLIPPVRQGMILQLGMSIMPARTVAHINRGGSTLPEHQSPQDVGQAVMFARLQSDEQKSIGPYDDMIRRFPEAPVLYASALNQACIVGPLNGPNRPETNPPGAPAKDGFRQLADTPDVRMVESLIRAGEKLEPENAYFDWSEVVLRFRQGRDAEALAAVHRAAGKTSCISHNNQEMMAQFSEIRRNTGVLVDWMNPLTRYGAAANFPFRYLARFRNAGMMVAWHIHHEAKAGNRERALSLMMDEVRFGGIMRDHSFWLIDALVGMAIQGSAIEGAYGGFVGPVPQTTGRKAMGSEHERMLSAIQSKSGNALSPADMKYLREQFVRATELRSRLDAFVRVYYTPGIRAMVLNSVLQTHMCVFSTLMVLFAIGSLIWGYWLRRRGRPDLKAGPTRLSVWLLAVLPGLAPAAYVLVRLGAMKSAEDLWSVFSGASYSTPWLFALIAGLLVLGIAAVGAQRHPDGERFNAFLARYRTGSIYAAQAILILYVLILLVCVPIAYRANSLIDKVITTGESHLVWQGQSPTK